MEQMLARLAELKAEGDAIMQQLIASGMPPEQIMAAMEGGGQQAAPPPMPMGGPGMGGGPGPDLPAGIEATNSAMGMGVPQGLLGTG
jgi:hypothetical protein